MKIEIRVPTQAGHPLNRSKIEWIKQVREELGLQLREAKSLADILWRPDMHIGNPEFGRAVIGREHAFWDQFYWLFKNTKFMRGACEWVRPLNDDGSPVHRSIAEILDSMERDGKPMPGNIKIVKPKPIKTPEDVLKETSIKLIRMGAVRNARDVLKILL